MKRVLWSAFCLGAATFFLARVLADFDASGGIVSALSVVAILIIAASLVVGLAVMIINQPSMGRYIGGRILWMIPTLLLMSLA
ncbi:MAG: hypothetical protein ACYDAR_14950, partial [Thermomicrobiales bacterium]